MCPPGNTVRFFAVVAAGFDQLLKNWRFGAHHFQVCALGEGNIRGDTNGLERKALLGFFVETHRAGASWQGREQLHPLHDAPQQSDVPIQVARRMANHDIQFGAAAAVHADIATRSDHAVTMRQPHLPGLGVARYGKAF